MLMKWALLALSGSQDSHPLRRATISSDLLNETLRASNENHCPPYNIEQTGDDAYRISLALAGFGPQDIAITAEQNVLTVEGRKTATGDPQ